MTARPFLNSGSVENGYDFTLSKREISHGWGFIALLSLPGDVAGETESRAGGSVAAGGMDEDAIVFRPIYMKYIM